MNATRVQLMYGSPEVQLAPPAYNDHLFVEHGSYPPAAAHQAASYKDTTTSSPRHHLPMQHQPPTQPIATPTSMSRHVPSPSSPHLLTHRPILIPQLTPPTLLTGPTPFLRCYAPILASYSISPHDFLAFIDGLNLAQHPPPPVQAVQLTGTAIGFVPHHWAQLASMGIGAAAGVGGKGWEVKRVNDYLGGVNGEDGLFRGRGLRVRVVGEEMVGRLLGGEVTAKLAEVDVRGGVVSLVERRMKALEGRVQVLVTEGLEGAGLGEGKEVGWIDRVSGKQVEMKVKKERGKREKEAWKLVEREGEGEGRKGAKKKEGKKMREREEKDRKAVGKLKWIVIEDMEGTRLG